MKKLETKNVIETKDYYGDNYVYKAMTIKKSDKSTAQVKLISTYLDNIESKTILRPIDETSYTGINGGFFDADKLSGFNKPPTSGSSICYTKGLDGVMVEHDNIKRVANFHENQSMDVAKAKKTMFIYKASNDRNSIAYGYVKHINELRAKFDILHAIGGTDYNIASWGNGYEKSDKRTVIAWTKPQVGVVTNVYMIYVDSATIPELKIVMSNIGLNPEYSVILDCGGSSTIQVNIDGNLIKTGGHRHIYNMVRVKKL